jgi:hypothetical protein
MQKCLSAFPAKQVSLTSLSTLQLSSTKGFPMALPEKIELKKTLINAVPALSSVASPSDRNYKEINTRCFQESFSILISHYKKELKLSKK